MAIFAEQECITSKGRALQGRHRSSIDGEGAGLSMVELRAGSSMVELHPCAEELDLAEVGQWALHGRVPSK